MPAAAKPPPASLPAVAAEMGYIRPVLGRNALGLAAVLLGMLYAGVSQNNAAAYLLAFLVFGIMLVSTIHSWNNLRGLALQVGAIAPVFEGDPLTIPLRLVPGPGRSHIGMEVRWRRQRSAPLVVPHVVWPEEGRGELSLPTTRRGVFSTLELEIYSDYPLGFFGARRRCRLQREYHVYPRPEGALPLPESAALQRESAVGYRMDGQDFYGLREWQLGESMRHIDWKAVARGQRLMTKQWRGGVSQRYLFTWAAVGALPAEARLRQLARWVQNAERLEAAYELQLPTGIIALGRGEAHRHRCLRALAEFHQSESTVAT